MSIKPKILIKKHKYMKGRIFALIGFLCLGLLNAQIGLNETDVHPEVSLQSGSTDKVWVLPVISSIDAVADPVKGMIAYSDARGGLLGYQKLDETDYYWSNLYLTEKLLIPKTETTTLASYVRDMGVYTYNTTYEITALETTFDVKQGRQDVVAQLNLGNSFTTSCFRGTITVELIDNTTGDSVDIITRLFNFGGLDGSQSVMPMQIVLSSVAMNVGSYTVKVYQNPNIETVCTVTGTFQDMTLSVTHF